MSDQTFATFFLAMIGFFIGIGASFTFDTHHSWINEEDKPRRRRIGMILYFVAGVFVAPALVKLWVTVLFG